MKVTVVCTKTLGDLYATPEQFAEMDDDDIINLVLEDLPEFIDGAEWTVQREAKAK